MRDRKVTPKKKSADDEGDDKASAAAKVTFLLPQGAKLFVDGRPVKAEGVATLRTPALKAGERYFYEVRAEVMQDGKPVVSTRQIELTPGAAIRADFRDMTGQDVAAR